MLNELYSMSQSLARCQLSVASKHERLKKNPREDGFILGIAADGTVATIEFCHKDRMKEIWKIDSGENGVSFPGFKLSGPLWLANTTTQDSVKKLLKLKKEAVSDRLALLKQIIHDAMFVTNTTEDRYLRKNLREFPAEVRRMLNDCPEEYRVLSDLLARLTESQVTEEAFLKSLSEAGMRAYSAGKLTAEATLAWQNLLLGKWESKKGQFTRSKTAVVLEPSGGTKYPFAITHPNTEGFINEQMNEKLAGKSLAKGGKGSEVKFRVDSLRGVEAEIQTRFPDPTLPVIGVTKLMSMTKDSPCQTRYGLQESDVFPVGKNTSQAMLDALLFLTQEEREGKTWRGVPNPEKGRDLLLAYLEDKPDASINLADFFAQDADDTALTEGVFEATVQKVCDALEGEPSVNPDSLLRVLVISSRDKGRKQIALNEAFQVKEILRSAEEWRSAGANCPPISIPLPPRGAEKYHTASPVCPPPAALLKCFNMQWTNEGTKSVWVSSCDLGQVYEIFLRQSAHVQSAAGRLLSLVLRRADSLLLALGNRQHGRVWSGFPDSNRLAALTAISTLAILLFKTGHRKENFMLQAPFNIGRLMSLADQLHALYCKEVRGDAPPQLFGNALMGTALQQPEKALSLFAHRVLPYQAWANTVNTGENVGLAKYFLKEIGAISKALSETAIPTTLSDAERAEMILGYLASSKSENKEIQ